MGSQLRTFRLDEITLDGFSSSSQGSFRGVSYLVRGSWEGRQILVKKLLPECRQHILSRYASSWHDLKHPNVLSVYGVSHSSEEPLFVVLPYHENGNIQEWITKRDGVDRNRLILDVALGMQYLHARQIVHGSLMPSNILINASGHACVSDYTTLQLQPSRSDDAHRYYSPEAWKGTTSQPSDVFAFAMSAFEIFSSSLPWGVLSEQRIYRLVVLEDARPDRPDSELCRRHGLNDKIWSIIEEAWHKESRLRPTFDIILRMWEDELVGSPTADSDPATAFDNMDRNSPRASRHTSESANTYLGGPPAYTDAADALESEASPGYDDYAQVTSAPNPPSEDVDVHPAAIRGAFISPVQVHNTLIRGRGRMLFPSEASSFVVTSSSSEKGRTVLTPPTSIQPGVGVDSPKKRMSMMSSGSRRASLPPPLMPHSAPATRSQFSIDSFETDFGRYHTPPRSTGSIPSSFSNMQSDLVRALPTMSRSESLQMWEERLVPSDAPQHSPQASTSVNRHYVRNYSLPSVTSDSGRLDTIQDIALLGEEDEGGGRPVDWNKRTSSSSLRLDGQSSSRSTIAARPSAVLLVQALQAEMDEGRKRESVDGYLIRMYESALESEQEAFKLVHAGAVPLLIHLLRTRAADEYGVELVLITLGTLAHDTISSNTIYRTGTTTTLVELCRSPPSLEVHTLAIWCLARICRSAEVAQSLIKQHVASILLKTCKVTSDSSAAESANRMIIPMALYALGTLIQSDGLAEYMASMGLIPLIANHLSLATASPDPEPNINALCSSIYALARISRSIKLAKSLAQAGCVELLSYHLKTSTDLIVLHWSARAVGCLMRPNSNDIAKILLEAGIAKGLARLPTVLPQDCDYDVIVKPLGSFGFAVQRFSCAEWGGGTRKALVEAGVVDSLLAALRAVRLDSQLKPPLGSLEVTSKSSNLSNATRNSHAEAHVELALAVSLLGDVGGTAIRKEIVNAGGITILKAVAGAGGPAEVRKACEMAITSVTGNVFSRNAASAKTAMAHNWSGGCPDFYPPCPLVVGMEE